MRMTTKAGNELIQRAHSFAKAKHEGQVRDGGEPFIAHPTRVVAIISQVTDNPAIIAAAWLHDVLEDTDASYIQLVDEFGSPVANLVLEVSKDGYNHFPNLKTKNGVMLKFADRLANISDMASWSAAEQNKYLAKSKFWK